MLNDLRQITKQGWRQRARVYLVTTGALALAMFAFGFDPVEQSASGASLWVAFAAGILALLGRAKLPAVTPQALKPTVVAEPSAPKIDRHAHDLESRNLNATRV
jgi:hypothetical protein